MPSEAAPGQRRVEHIIDYRMPFPPGYQAVIDSHPGAPPGLESRPGPPPGLDDPSDMPSEAQRRVEDIIDYRLLSTLSHATRISRPTVRRALRRRASADSVEEMAARIPQTVTINDRARVEINFSDSDDDELDNVREAIELALRLQQAALAAGQVPPLSDPPQRPNTQAAQQASLAYDALTLLGAPLQGPERGQLSVRPGVQRLNTIADRSLSPITRMAALLAREIPELDATPAKKTETARLAKEREVNRQEDTLALRYSRACAVCLDAPNPRVRVALTGCGHILCSPCSEQLEGGAGRKVKCPFCRSPGRLLRLYEDVVEDEEKRDLHDKN